MSRHNPAFKIRIAKAYLAGGIGSKALAAKHGVCYARVRSWVKLYNAHGRRGLARKYGHYSGRFKLSALRRMWARKLSAFMTPSHR